MDITKEEWKAVLLPWVFIKTYILKIIWLLQKLILLVLICWMMIDSGLLAMMFYGFYCYYGKLLKRKGALSTL